jgi:biotin-(acetyl-CoA carboxylase) ligase
MGANLSLPPLYEARALPASADPLAVAVQTARRSDATGSLFYAERPDRVEMALVLGPEGTLLQSLPVLYPLTMALGDALGSTLPPQIGVQFGWPDRILMNGALAGALRLLSPTDDLKAVPDWLLAGFTLDVMGDPTDPEPGRNPDRTSLFEEGAVEVNPGMILEAFARHFLAWLNRWEEEGLAPLETPWLARAIGFGLEATFAGQNGRVTGKVEAISREGNLVLDSGKRKIVLPISNVLLGEGWREARRR